MTWNAKKTFCRDHFQDSVGLTWISGRKYVLLVCGNRRRSSHNAMGGEYVIIGFWMSVGVVENNCGK